MARAQVIDGHHFLAKVQMVLDHMGTDPAPPVTKMLTGLSPHMPYAVRARLVGSWRFCFGRLASIAKNYVYQDFTVK